MANTTKYVKYSQIILKTKKYCQRNQNSRKCFQCLPNIAVHYTIHIHCQILPNTATYRILLPNIANYCKIRNFAKYMLPNPAICCHSSPNTTKEFLCCRRISKCFRMLQNGAKCIQIL